MARNSYGSDLLLQLPKYRAVPTKHHMFQSEYCESELVAMANDCFAHVTALKGQPLSDTDRDSFQCIETMYLREVWVSECDGHGLSEGETTEVVTCAFEDSAKPSFVDNRTWLKVQNIYEAMKLLGVTTSTVHDGCAGFSVDLIKAVHQAVGNSLMDGSGEFRTHEVGAAGTNVVYLPYTRVESRLNTLVDFVKAQLETITQLEPTNRLKEAAALTALFFSEFLQIHPFSNGNGRCARLLVNYLLAGFCVVPVSIFFSMKKDDYLTILMESQRNGNHGGLTLMFLHCIYKTARSINYLLLTDE
jgi:Fic family protein